MKLPEFGDKALNLKENRETIPFYYQKVMKWTYRIMLIYMICCDVLCLSLGHRYVLQYAAVFSAAVVAAQFINRKVTYMTSQLIYAVLVQVWFCVSVMVFGWSVGTTQLVFPLLIIIFFSVYYSLWQKILWLILLFVVRIVLLFLSRKHGAVIPLSDIQNYVFHIINSAAVFTHTGILCYIFSSNIQQSEKQLMAYAEEQSIKAKTDPLTRLMNRRAMEELLETKLSSPEVEYYSIGMLDIDLFKQVNDRYGHEAGDVVLQELADLFFRICAGNAYAARWGGEEFLFFMPQKNLDEATGLMTDINVGVSRKKIRYKDMDISVTVTIGVEEEYRKENLEEAIRSADEKLYMGKRNGRNRVVA